MKIDSLIVSLGLDPEEFFNGLSQVQGLLQAFNQGLKDFGSGFAEGAQEALQEMAQSTQGANSAAVQAGEAGKEMGQKFQKGAEQGKRGVDKMNESTDKAGKKAQKAGNAMQQLGNRWGGVVSGLVSRFAGPLTAALSVGSMFSSYSSGVAQVAQMYGRWTPQMEEWRKKRDLLSRVNREDIELYRKAKLSMLDFQSALAGLSTTVMRSLSPAFRYGIELLNKVSDWVRRNEPNIIRFITVLAGTITAVLIPSFVKMAAAMLANPLTWIIGAIVALAIAIDDLVVYINGGESAFGEFWAKLGTGPELAEALATAWENLQAVGTAVWNGLVAGLQFFWENFHGVFDGLADIVVGVLNIIKGLFTGNFNDIVKGIQSVFSGIQTFLVGIFTGVVNSIKAAFQGAISLIKEWFTNMLSSIPGLSWALGKMGITGGGASEGTPAEAASAPVVPSSETLTETAVPASASSNNQTNVSAETSIGVINIQTQATDAEGIARDMGAAMKDNPLMSGVYAADGGVTY